MKRNLIKTLTLTMLFLSLAFILTPIQTAKATPTNSVTWYVSQYLDSTLVNDFVTMKQNYGNPTALVCLFWTDDNPRHVGNLVPFITSKQITTLHNAGIQVFQHIDTHSITNWDTANYDLVLKWIGQTPSNVDGFFLDVYINSVNSTWVTFYQNLISYIHSMGKLVWFNLSGSAISSFAQPNIYTIMNETDVICIENSWQYWQDIPQSIINRYLGKWSASLVGGPYTDSQVPMPVSTAVSTTQTLWQESINNVWGNNYYVEGYDINQHISEINSYLSQLLTTGPNFDPNPTSTTAPTSNATFQPLNNSELITGLVAIGMLFASAFTIVSIVRNRPKKLRKLRF